MIVSNGILSGSIFRNLSAFEKLSKDRNFSNNNIASFEKFIMVCILFADLLG